MHIIAAAICRRGYFCLLCERAARRRLYRQFAVDILYRVIRREYFARIVARLAEIGGVDYLHAVFELKFNAVYSVYRRVAVCLYVERFVFYTTAVLFGQYHEKITVVFSAHVERHKIIRGGCVGVVENHAVNIFSVVSRLLGILQFEKIQCANIVVLLSGIDDYAVFVPLEIIFDIFAFEA